MANTTNTRARKATPKAATKATAAPDAPALATTATTATAPDALATAAPDAPAYGLRAAPTKQGTRRTMLPEAATVAVTYMVDGKAANPKRHGSGAHVRFAQYLRLHNAKGAHGFTVQDVLNAGVQPSDLLYNLRHGYIEVQGVTMQGSNVVVAQ